MMIDRILKSIHLGIKKGEKIAIVGKNGAGKSTLAKALSSFIQTEGRYLWEGQDIKEILLQSGRNE